MSIIVSSDECTKKYIRFLPLLAFYLLSGCGGGGGSGDDTTQSTDNSPSSADIFLSTSETKSILFQNENQVTQTSRFRYLEVPSGVIKAIDTEGEPFVLEQTGNSDAIYLKVSGQLTIN